VDHVRALAGRRARLPIVGSRHVIPGRCALIGAHLAPAMQKLQIPPPQVAVYPLHNLSAYPTIERFMVR
jgi:hypothetical protein